MPTDPPTFDLQSHSLHSDGALGVSELVRAAASAGVQLLALTDHDTVDGVAEALEAGDRLGLRVVPAVEISTIDESRRDLHVLGYLIDHQDHALGEALDTYRAARKRRANAMIAALEELGFELEKDMLRERAARGRSVGRPHLAQAVLAHRANAARLAAEGLAEPSAFLADYLIAGRPAFRPRDSPAVSEAIQAIHSAGGVAIWAHPFWDLEQPAAVVERIDSFLAVGLDGVECFYPTHSRAQAGLLAVRCRELGLLSTGSSDFHGPEHREFGRFGAFSTYGRRADLGPIAA